MNDDIEEIKKRLDIVDFISGYLTLKKSGVNYKAPCPFHQEKTPSFMVSPEKQIFKCFGCSESGDIFSFVMKMEGLNFPEAIELLANRAGVIIEKSKSKEEYQKEKDVKSRLYKINKLAAQVYHKILLEHSSAKIARDYLKKRKISSQTIKDFILGYAPTKSVLEEFLRSRGFSSNEIYQAGNPDRFKNRLIFPISDQMGNVVGFTGRILDPNDQPKYLNTPETAIFHKSRVLYGLNLAKQTIKQEKNALIVEGQMDVISSHQSGVNNAVATSGTALTESHLDILSRYSPNITFAFDQDEAGSAASKKSLQMAITNGLNAKIVVFPEGFKDAGEIVEHDPDLWKSTVQKSQNGLDWFFHETFKPFGAKNLSGQDKKEIARQILPFIAIIPDAIEKQHYIKALTNKLDSKENLIIDALNRITKITKNKEVQTSQKSLSPEDNLVGLVLAFPDLIKRVVQKIDYIELLDQDLAKIYKHLEICYTKDSCPDAKTQKTCNSGQNIIKCLKSKLADDKLMARLESLLLEIETTYRNFSKEELELEIEKNILRVKKTQKELVKEKFAKAIKTAESAGNIQEVKKLLQEFQNAIR